MKKYTNKILAALIILLTIIVLSVPISIWINASLIKPTPALNPQQLSREYLNYKDFTALNIRGAWQVQILPGAFKIELNDQQNTQYLSLNQQTLTLDNSKLAPNHPMASILIHLPTLNGLNISGANKVTVNDFKSTDMAKLSLDLAGASELNINNSSYPNVNIDMSGSSTLKFSHSILEHVNLDLSGVSTLELDQLVHGKLSGSSSGLTNIHYNGSLDENTLDSSGLSNISGTNN